MASTSYSYAINSFPNSKVDLSRLEQEVLASSIATALDHISKSGDSTSVVFKGALSDPDKSILDTLVGQHSGEPLPVTAQPVSLDVPTTTDGKLIVQPSMFPAGVYLYITGAGDDGARGNGQPFSVASDAAGDSSVVFTFKDWVYLSAGGMMWQGAEFGDSVTFDFYAPATPVTPNGAHTGNCNLVDPGVGAAILLVPANGNGAYDVNLANAVPVPAYGANSALVGYWDWSEPDTGLGTIQGSSTPGHAAYHLFAVAAPLVKFVNRMPLLGSGAMDMQPPPIKSKKMLPHWRGRVTLHNAGHAGLKVAWYLATARASTT
jgi:hypothetical protein